MITVESLVREALSMPPKDRAAIARRLIVSLDDEVDLDADEAWKCEIQGRLEELDRGNVICVPWQEVREGFGRRK